MANRYVHASKISEETFLDVLFCYCNLDSPTIAAEKTGISRQSATTLFLRLSNRLRHFIPVEYWTFLYEDVRELGFTKDNNDGSVRLNNYGQFFHKDFLGQPKEWFKARNDNGERKLEKGRVWQDIARMNNSWKPIPHKFFDTHLSIIFLRGMLYVQIHIKHELDEKNGKREAFWQYMEQDWPHVNHGRDLKTLSSQDNMAHFVIEDVKKILIEKPLCTADDKKLSIAVDVVSHPNFSYDMLQEALDKGFTVPLAIHFE